MPNKVLVILGMHRSGTSVVTHWLHACGLPIGDALLGGGVGNVEGHFEDLELYRLQRGWLERAGLPHTGYVHAPVPPLTAAQRAELGRLIAARNRRFPQWGWKEPRTCLFLAEHRAAIPDAHYLVLYRDPVGTVSSLIRRDLRRRDEKYGARRSPRSWWWFRVRRALRSRRLLRRDAARLLRVWIFYNREILRGIRDLDASRCLVTNVEALVRDDGAAAFRTLAAEWGFDLHPVGFRTVYRTEFAGAPLDLAPWIDPALVREAQGVYAELEASGGGPRTAAAATARPA